jgi:hypothetical protein
MGLDFALGLVVSRLVFALSWAWSLGFGLFLSALAVLSRLVASVLLDRRRPARHVRLALRLGVAAWLILLSVLLAAYLVRTGVLGVGLLSVLMPLMWLAFLGQSVAFAVLVEALAFPGQTYERFRMLIRRRTELEELQELMQSELPPDDGPGCAIRRPAGPKDTPTATYSEHRKGATRRRTRVARSLAMVLLGGSLALGAQGANAGQGPSASITRLVLAPDESPGREDTEEFMRVRRVLGNALGELVAALPGAEDVAVIHWSGATTVWAAGDVFTLPHQRLAIPLEANLAFFGKAKSLLQTSDDERDRVLQTPVVESARRDLLTRPVAPANQSCVTQLLIRALEAPATQLWVVVTDLQDYRCPIVPHYIPGGARVLAVVIPQEEDAATRARVEARIARLNQLFPEVVVARSWDIEDSSDLRRLVVRIAASVSSVEAAR